MPETSDDHARGETTRDRIPDDVVRVVAIDEDRLFLDGLAALFERTAGYDLVACARNGLSAVQQCEQSRPDVLLAAPTLPSLDGASVTRRVLALDAPPAVIALCSLSDAERVERMLAAGVAGYVVKRCPFDILLSAVETVRAGRRFICREAAAALAGDLHTEATTDDRPASHPLTARECDVLSLLADGMSSKEIAGHLAISVRTVEHHRSRLMAKTDAHSVAQLTKIAIRRGLSPL